MAFLPMAPACRPCRCLQQHPEDGLPTASVILCFHDEAWSTLLRTVHSILDTAPRAFLKEVILVDDLSQQGGCGLPPGSTRREGILGGVPCKHGGLEPVQEKFPEADLQMRIQVQVIHDGRAPGATSTEVGEQDRNGEEDEQSESLGRVAPAWAPGISPPSPDLLRVPSASAQDTQEPQGVATWWVFPAS